MTVFKCNGYEIAHQVLVEGLRAVIQQHLHDRSVAVVGSEVQRRPFVL